MGIWSQAGEIAEQTPASRNRYVDFLRAASILFVITGHWLIATAYFESTTGDFSSVMMLEVAPWTCWLTWLFQVMPIFFIVGGYSNAISLESATKNNTPFNYANWLTGRLHRLLTPLLVLIVFWAFMAFGLNLFGASTDTVVFASQAALVPTWFLAIYTMIVLLAPATYAFWRRWGFLSLGFYVLMAALVDLAFFQWNIQWLGWSNYFWIWLAVHHLGFAWHDGRLGKPSLLIAVSAVALLVLMLLIFKGPYPLAMAGSPGEAVSNTLPPKITLIALGVFQFGLLLAIEKPMQRLLAGLRFWTCTVIINTMIMTIYLWHMTILVLVLGLSYISSGFGLTLVPNSADWWYSRPLWLAVLLCLLLPIAMLMSPLERVARAKDAPVPSSARLVIGAVMAGAGIAAASLFGFNGDLLSLKSIAPLVLVLGGAAICGLSLRLR